jgi:hypothetical protein
MVHPCGARLDNPGSDRRTKLHACATESSSVTLCGLDVFGVDVTGGYDSICATCFPAKKEQGQQEGGDDGRPIGK